MKQETFQKALIATARITCCASIFGLGCGEKSGETGELTEVQECQDHLEDKFPDAESGNTVLASKKTKDCCTLVGEYYDELALQEDGTHDWTISSEWEQRNQCCEALNWDTSITGCTPWGPPMPPKIRAVKIHRPEKLQRIQVRSV